MLDANACVRTWNRWSENAWGLREEEVTGHPFAQLDIGLPVQQLTGLVQQTLTQQTPGEATLEALDRRGRAILCRVRVSPLLNEDRTAQGVVLLVEDQALTNG